MLATHAAEEVNRLQSELPWAPLTHLRAMSGWTREAETATHFFLARIQFHLSHIMSPQNVNACLITSVLF